MQLQSNATSEYFWSRLDRLSDGRTKGWPLVDSPLDVVLVIFAYLAMVRWGPRIMETRKPFKMKGVLIAYNFFQVAFSALICKEIALGSYRQGYNFLCHPCPRDTHPEEMRVVRGLWLFYISKVIDFLDSLFFILRKKSSQLSFLHVFHHSTMLLLTWISVKWYPSGAASYLPMINSFVHTVMYTYYALSAIGPTVQKYLWWKKYLTGLQLVQFVMSMAWSVNSLLRACNHEAWIDLLNIVYMCAFLYLFGRFYARNYNKKLN